MEAQRQECAVPPLAGLFLAQDRIAQAPHLVIFPGLFVVASVVAFVLLGEALRKRASNAR